MAENSCATSSYELFMIVERLSRHDRRRIVRLIDLLGRAPAELCETIQRELRQLITSAPASHAECVAGMELIIERAELALSDLESFTLHTEPARQLVSGGRSLHR